MADLNLIEAVRAERAKYPAVLTIDQPAKILNAVAWDNRADGWGLSVKLVGNRVPSPQGVDVAYDILHDRNPTSFAPFGRLFGCFTDELRATVNWGEESYHGDPTGRPWLAPIDPATVGGPVDPTDPGEPEDTLTPRIVALEAAVAALTARVDALPTEVPPLDRAAVTALVEAILEGYEVNGKTGTDILRLQHPVKLGLTKRKP